MLDMLGVRGVNAKGSAHRLVEITSGPSGGLVGTTNPTVNDSQAPAAPASKAEAREGRAAS